MTDGHIYTIIISAAILVFIALLVVASYYRDK